MNQRAMQVLSSVNRQIREKIQRYATKHGISYEEAAKRAVLSVDGIKLKGVPISETSITVERKDDKKKKST